MLCIMEGHRGADLHVRLVVAYGRQKLGAQARGAVGSLDRLQNMSRYLAGSCDSRCVDDDVPDGAGAMIWEQGCKTGLVFNRATPLQWLDKPTAC